MELEKMSKTDLIEILRGLDPDLVKERSLSIVTQELKGLTDTLHTLLCIRKHPSECGYLEEGEDFTLHTHKLWLDTTRRYLKNYSLTPYQFGSVMHAAFEIINLMGFVQKDVLKAPQAIIELLTKACSHLELDTSELPCSEK